MLNENAKKTEYMIISSKKRNRGAAMVIAIIVVAVLMIFAFSLLLVSYTLFATQNKKVASKKSSEAANSLSIAMADEMDETKNPEAYKNSDFWIYLRYHLLQGDWTYYEPALDGHREADAVKGFEMKLNPNYIETGKSTVDGYPGTVKIKAYWMLPKQMYEEHSIETKPEEFDNYDYSSTASRGGIRLFLEITCESASQSYTVTNEYQLSVRPYDTAVEDEQKEMDKIASYSASNYSSLNGGKTINSEERWRWVFKGRE